MNEERDSCDNNLIVEVWRGDLARDLLLEGAEAGGKSRGRSIRPRLAWKPAIRC
jgi:hypothetical protein